MIYDAQGLQNLMKSYEQKKRASHQPNSEGVLISMQMAIKNCELVFKKLPLTFVQGQCLKNSPYAPIFY